MDPVTDFISRILTAIVYGVVEGVSEWLPISSTGHLILLEAILPLRMSAAFGSAFRIVIQLGAVMAVPLLYWSVIWPFGKPRQPQIHALGNRPPVRPQQRPQAGLNDAGLNHGQPHSRKPERAQSPVRASVPQRVARPAAPQTLRPDLQQEKRRAERPAYRYQPLNGPKPDANAFPPRQMSVSSRQTQTVKGQRSFSFLRPDVLMLWAKLLLACVPAAIVGLFFDDLIEKHFYNPLPVALALIIVGLLFIIVEQSLKGKHPRILTLNEMSWSLALIIGLFQVLAAVFPGVSRSGATILGALIFGVSRKVASEFTFLLALPVMLGASLLKLLRLNYQPQAIETVILLVACLSAFIVSILTMRFLISYVQKHDFKAFAYYRIALGVLVLVLFTFM